MSRNIAKPATVAPLTGTAGLSDVLSGKTFYNDDAAAQRTGSMINKVGSATVITPGTTDQTIAAGYYGGAAGDGKVLGDADLIAANIISGKNIFGVGGSAVPLPATITAGDTPVKYAQGVLHHGTSVVWTDMGISMTMNKAGTYRFKYGFGVGMGSPIDAYIKLYKNGAEIAGTSQGNPNQVDDYNFSADIAVSAGDVISVWGNIEGTTTFHIFFFPLIACINWSSGL